MILGILFLAILTYALWVWWRRHSPEGAWWWRTGPEVDALPAARLRRTLDWTAAAEQALQATLHAVGPARCRLSILALQQMARCPDHAGSAWDQLEGPLLTALPDCPPDLKPALHEALRTAAANCPQRAAAQGMMTIARSLE